MANLITAGRLVVLFVVVGLIYWTGGSFIGVNMALVALIIASDGFDGWVARRRQTTSAFGAILDIAGDRVVENVLWIIFADLGAVPIWVPLLVVTRGVLVDGLRSVSYGEGMTAFGERNMMRSSFSRWLTAGRFMRALYGYAKAIAFIFLAGWVGRELSPDVGGWVQALYSNAWYRIFGWASVWSAIALTVIRGVPVIVDAWHLMVPASMGPERSAERADIAVGRQGNRR